MNNYKSISKNFKIVDSHHHFWDLSMKKHPWLCDRPLIKFRYGNYEKICKNFLVKDFKNVSKNFNVSKTIHMEAEWDTQNPFGEIQWLQSLYDQFGFPNAAVGQIWLHHENSNILLKKYAQSLIVKSVRQKPNYDDNSKEIVKLSDESFLRGYKNLEKYKLHYDLQIPWKYLTEAFNLSSLFPKTIIILNHAGLPYDRSKLGIQKWKEAISLFSQRPNVAVKISGIGVPNQKWNKKNNEVIVNFLIEKFGVERCMFGSNFPVDSLCATYDQIVETLFECTQSLSMEEHANIFYSNAIKYYNPL